MAEEATESSRAVFGVKRASILFLLPNFDIVKSFVPDYMHSVLLGVTRQFVNLWMDTQAMENLSILRKLLSLMGCYAYIKPPDEIRCLPRPLRLRTESSGKHQNLNFFAYLFTNNFDA